MAKVYEIENEKDLEKSPGSELIMNVNVIKIYSAVISGNIIIITITKLYIIIYRAGLMSFVCFIDMSCNG